MPLIAFSTGRPRNGAPEKSKNAPRPMAYASLIDFSRGYNTSHLSHIIFVLFIPYIEFPRLLAKREIIANALFLPTMSFGNCPERQKSTAKLKKIFEMATLLAK